ncbi:hypothetical protein [Streptomyces griseorubiginosus]|uniref:hypothetical protein n=1 Tax=Streptomyces griseorubiginosus TaxID=67304 RepID=UPI003677FE53
MIAPVIIGTDADLVDNGLAVADRVALRAALGDVGATEGRMADLERQASVLANLTSDLVSEPKKLAAVAVLRTAAGRTTGGSGSTRESQRPGSRCCLWCWSALRSAGRN